MGIFSKSSDNAQGNYDNIPIATAVAVPISHAAPMVQEVATTLPVTFDLGRNPVQMNCPMCKKQNVTTRTKTYPNWMTWAAAAGMALIFWPVFWIPLVIDPVRLVCFGMNLLLLVLCNVTCLLISYILLSCSTLDYNIHLRQRKQNIIVATVMKMLVQYSLFRTAALPSVNGTPLSAHPSSSSDAVDCVYCALFKLLYIYKLVSTFFKFSKIFL